MSTPRLIRPPLSQDESKESLREILRTWSSQPPASSPHAVGYVLDNYQPSLENPHLSARDKLIVDYLIECFQQDEFYLYFADLSWAIKTKYFDMPSSPTTRWYGHSIPEPELNKATEQTHLQSDNFVEYGGKDSFNTFAVRPDENCILSGDKYKRNGEYSEKIHRDSSPALLKQVYKSTVSCNRPAICCCS